MNNILKGTKGDWDFRISDLKKKTLMELIFNPCGEFRWSPEGPVSQIHSPHLHAGAPGIFSDLLRSVQMLKKVWGSKSNRKLPHLFIPSKSTTLVPEFAVEELSSGRTEALVHEFAVRDLPLGRTLMMMTIFKIINLYMLWNLCIKFLNVFLQNLMRMEHFEIFTIKLI